MFVSSVLPFDAHDGGDSEPTQEKNKKLYLKKNSSFLRLNQI